MEQCVRELILKLLPGVLKLEELFVWDRLMGCLAQTLSPKFLEQHKDEIYELVRQYSTTERLHSAIDTALSDSSLSTTMTLFAPHTILSSPPRQDPSSIITNNRTWTKVRPNSKGFIVVDELPPLEDRWKGACFVFTAEDDNYVGDRMLSRCQLHSRVRDGRIFLRFALGSNSHQIYSSTFCVASVSKSPGFDVLLGKNWDTNDAAIDVEKDDTIRRVKRRRSDLQAVASQPSASETITTHGALDSPEAIGLCIGSAIRAYNSSCPHSNATSPGPTI